LVADADLLVGQAIDGKILPELSKHEVIPAELTLPVVIGLHLVDKDRPLLASVTSQVPLPIAINVGPPDHPPTLHWLLPDGGSHRLPAPCDVAGKANVH